MSSPFNNYQLPAGAYVPPSMTTTPRMPPPVVRPVAVNHSGVRMGCYTTHFAKKPHVYLTMQQLAVKTLSPSIARGGVHPALADKATRGQLKAQAELITPFDGDAKVGGAAEGALFYVIPPDHDHDNQTAAQIRQRYGDKYRVSFLAWTTSSNTDDSHKWKVVIPTSRPLTAQEWLKIATGLAYEQGTDPAQARKQQGFYAPHKLIANAPYECINALDDYPVLDVDDESHPLMVAALSGWAKLEALRIAEESKIEESKRNAHNAPEIKHAPMQLLGVDAIALIHELAPPMPDLLCNTFGAKQVGDRFVHPQSTSGAAGIVLLGADQMYYSHHGNDPLANGHKHSKLNVILCYQFGITDFNEQDKESRAKILTAVLDWLDPLGQAQRRSEFAKVKGAADLIKRLADDNGGVVPEPSKIAKGIVKKSLDAIRQTLAPTTEAMSDDDLTTMLEVQPLVLDLMINQSVRHSNSRGVIHLLTKDGKVNNHTEEKCWSHMTAIHGAPYSQEALLSLVELHIESCIDPATGKGLSIEKKKALHKEIGCPMRAAVLWQIEHSNQVISQTFRVDRFISDAYIDITEAEAHYMLPHVEYKVANRQDRLKDGYNPDLIAEYLTHFEQFNELIEQTAASLFTNDRKEAYNWLQAESNAGKGLLQAAFEALGMVTTISVQELDACMIGAPVGKQPHMFTRSNILWINEVKKITGNVKMLENSLSITPKFQSESRVELYVKMFTSAEDVPSLINSFGSEEQLLNRFSKLGLNGKVTELAWFKKLGKDAYRRHLSDYIMQRMNALVEQYRAMGRDAASLAAAEVLAEFHSKHGLIQHGKNLTESLHEIADDFLQYLHGGAHQPGHLGRVVEVDPLSGAKGLRAPLKTLIEWLDSEYDKSELGQVNWKRDELLKMISHDGKGEVKKLAKDDRPKVIILRPKP